LHVSVSAGPRIAGIDDEYPQWIEQCMMIAQSEAIEALEAGRAEMMAGLQVVLATEGNPEPLAFLMHVMDEHIAHLTLVAELPQHPHFRTWLADGTRVEGLER
jgi:hypothetical protein